MLPDQNGRGGRGFVAQAKGAMSWQGSSGCVQRRPPTIRRERQNPAALTRGRRLGSCEGWGCPCEQEGMGFEPTVHLYSAQRFSKPPPSAARPPLRRAKPYRTRDFGASPGACEARKFETKKERTDAPGTGCRICSPRRIANRPGALEMAVAGVKPHCVPCPPMLAHRPLLGDRLTVGQQTLTLLIVVRIHVPQPRHAPSRS